MLEPKIDGQTYRVGKLTAFQQLHLSRKIAPVVPKILSAYLSGTAVFEQFSNGEIEIGKIIGFIESLEAPAQALASMPEADVDYVFGLCLGAVSIKQGEAWASIWVQPGRLMFDFIDLAVMTQLVYEVIGSNLGPFIKGLLAKARANNPEIA